VTATADFAAGLGSPISAAGYQLMGLYLHGSVVLGGFRPGSSDLDVLAVVAEPMDVTSQQSLGEALVDAARHCPATGLEMSIVTVATARDAGNCPFEVHVCTVPDDESIQTGAGHPGDPDLILHLEVSRRHGLAVLGAPPRSVIAPISRERLRDAILDELEWGVEHAPLSYAVLNACRALRFAADRELVSKVDAGRWYQHEYGDHDVVAEALQQQETGQETEPLPEAARRFVGHAKGILLSG
jgi:Aminoglycoside adenylyltransferase, C-terminal domain